VGGLASILRFLVDDAISARLGARFPTGTLVVNLTGTAVLGLVTGLALTGDALLIVGSGLLGGYTTFSTWMLETHRAAEDGRTAIAWANVALSVAAGLLAIVAGRALGRVL
jgi:CrcB protein